MSKNTYCTFYIIRHGETEWNVKKKLQGHADSPLTEKGINQAEVLGRELQKLRFDAAFSSDSLRAQRTAEIIALQHNITVTTNQLLREKHLGKWEGKPYSIFSNELKHLFNEFLSLPEKKKMSYKYPDMESDEELVIRFITFLRETAIVYPGKTILVVTHGGMMRALLIHLGFGTYDEVPSHSVSNSASMKLESDGIDFFLKDTKGVTKK